MADEKRPGIFRRIWNGWLKFARIVGTVQMVIFLTLIYWTIFMFMAIPYRLFSDSLGNKVRGGTGWMSRQPVTDRWEQMQNQG